MNEEIREIPFVPCKKCGGRRFWWKKKSDFPIGENEDNLYSPGHWECCWCHHPPDDKVISVITLGVCTK